MDKEGMLELARKAAEQAGGRFRVEGDGDARHVVLAAPDGRTAIVWFPAEPRVHDLEVKDLREAVNELFGNDLWDGTPTLTRADLDAMKCDDCGAPGRESAVHLRPRCHPESGSFLSYFGGAVRSRCAACGEAAEDIAVAAGLEAKATRTVDETLAAVVRNVAEHPAKDRTDVEKAALLGFAEGVEFAARSVLVPEEECKRLLDIAALVRRG